jgi:hypothetical protein
MYRKGDNNSATREIHGSINDNKNNHEIAQSQARRPFQQVGATIVPSAVNPSIGGHCIDVIMAQV